MKVRFWGTRGSVPTPGPRTARFGGNTSCVEIQADDGTRIVIDCGTGARELGTSLLAEGGAASRIHLLISHTHWDHIQGFPFFGPAYVPGFALDIYSPPGLEGTLEASLSGQMQYTYFPVRLADLQAGLTFHELGEGGFQAGGVHVEAQYLNHTAPALGYRLNVGGVTVVYSSDHEPFWWPGDHPRDGWVPVHPGDARHVSFLEGADVVIHDAQYLDREYVTKRGWGHSTMEYVTDMAAQAGVRQLVLFHHDPTHDDRLVAATVRLASRRAGTRGSGMEVIAAAEGLELVLPERADADPVTRRAPAMHVDSEPRGARLLVAGGDDQDLAALRESLAPEGHQLLPLPDATPLAVGVEQVRPALVLLAAGPSLPDPLRAAAQLRADAPGTKLPIVAILGEAESARAGELLAEATDIVARPWSPPMLRSRVRAWLARSRDRSRWTPATSRRRVSAGARGRARVPELFKGLPAPERAALLANAADCRLAVGEVLFREGDPAEGIYFIREGTIQVSARSTDEQEVVLAVLGTGETVGELAALDAGSRTATAVALERTVLDYVPREAFMAGLSASPQACLRLLRLLAARLRATDRRVGELAFGDIPSRVARHLLRAGEVGADADLSVAALSTRAGIDQPRLERALLLLEAGGFIGVDRGRVRVVDRAGLVNFVFE